jgi:hypothetical protein
MTRKSTAKADCGVDRSKQDGGKHHSKGNEQRHEGKESGSKTCAQRRLGERNAPKRRAAGGCQTRERIAWLPCKRGTHTVVPSGVVAGALGVSL